MKLEFVSISAAADYTDADKHINLGKATTAGKKIEVAAKKFAAAQAKGDAVAAKVMTKLAAKTARQIEKALAPIAYYYVSKKTKPVPFSAAKQKAQDVTYLRKRAVRVMTRKRPSDAYTLVFAAYNQAILGKEAAAIQRDLIKAVEMHGTNSVKTKETATKVSTQRQDEASKQFNANVAVLSEIIGTKVKPEQMFNYVPMRGVPATYITLPNKGVLVVRHADAAQLRAIKKKAAEDAAKASTSSVSESAVNGMAAREIAVEQAKKKIEKSYNSTKSEAAKIQKEISSLLGKLGSTAEGKEHNALKKRIRALRLDKVMIEIRHDKVVAAAVKKYYPTRLGVSKYTFRLKVSDTFKSVHPAKEPDDAWTLSYKTGEPVFSKSADLKSIVARTAKSAKDSGGKVTYDRMGGYHIECDGDAIAYLQHDEAEDFEATVDRYYRAGVDKESAMLAAAWPWIENSV